MSLIQFENVANFLGNCLNAFFTNFLDYINIGGYSLLYITIVISMMLIGFLVIKKVLR